MCGSVGIPGFQCPDTRAGMRDFFADENTDFAGEHIDPDVILVHV